MEYHLFYKERLLSEARRTRMKYLIRVVMLGCVVTVLLSALSLQSAKANVPLSGNGPCSNPPCAFLNEVAAVSATDIWAVGSYLKLGYINTTLTEQWNGTQWKVVKSLNQGKYGSQFNSVAAVSANDVWAVGSYSKNPGAGTLTEQWNGTQWKVVKSPSPGTYNSELFAVVAVSANDVWAVGDYGNSDGTGGTLTEQWNGTQWKVVKSPSPGTYNSELFAVVAVSANDVWAVGGYGNSDGTTSTLTEQWNGTQWSMIRSPVSKIGQGPQNGLYGVAAVSANNVWAVGKLDSTGMTLTEQWNGTQWSVVSSPSPGTNGNELSAVAAVSANDVWAVGNFGNNNSLGMTLIEQWNGTQWSVVSNPNPGSFADGLSGVAVVSANDIWAVGFYVKNNYRQMTLIEQWNGTQWSVVPSPN
jgi:hypothetical protein